MRAEVEKNGPELGSKDDSLLPSSGRMKIFAIVTFFLYWVNSWHVLLHYTLLKQHATKRQTTKKEKNKKRNKRRPPPKRLIELSMVNTMTKIVAALSFHKVAVELNGLNTFCWLTLLYILSYCFVKQQLRMSTAL